MLEILNWGFAYFLLLSTGLDISYLSDKQRLSIRPAQRCCRGYALGGSLTWRKYGRQVIAVSVTLTKCNETHQCHSRCWKCLRLDQMHSLYLPAEHVCVNTVEFFPCNDWNLASGDVACQKCLSPTATSGDSRQLTAALPACVSAVFPDKQ
jgi:hypothetical protein